MFQRLCTFQHTGVLIFGVYVLSGHCSRQQISVKMKGTYFSEGYLFTGFYSIFWRGGGAMVHAVNPEYFVRTQFSYPGLSDLSYAWNFCSVADRCVYSDLPCTFHMHFIFVRKPPRTKYTKITCIRNIFWIYTNYSNVFLWVCVWVNTEEYKLER